jgi:hypothetical protein
MSVAELGYDTSCLPHRLIGKRQLGTSSARSGAGDRLSPRCPRTSKAGYGYRTLLTLTKLSTQSIRVRPCIAAGAGGSTRLRQRSRS